MLCGVDFVWLVVLVFKFDLAVWYVGSDFGFGILARFFPGVCGCLCLYGGFVCYCVNSVVFIHFFICCWFGDYWLL